MALDVFTLNSELTFLDLTEKCNWHVSCLRIIINPHGNDFYQWVMKGE